MLTFDQTRQLLQEWLGHTVTVSTAANFQAPVVFVGGGILHSVEHADATMVQQFGAGQPGYGFVIGTPDAGRAERTWFYLWLAHYGGAEITPGQWDRGELQIAMAGVALRVTVVPSAAELAAVRAATGT